ncbi:TRAP transporter T-component [Nitrosomonas aestuarii]|uniref:TRAP transporter T-component n=1 Tax=Nitrosomonas aestuarii TaxID=52441 RepID=A0A1I3XHT9_9PROT|nr:TRAP transporter TatT component family protein [Nitrosomonas aestuarii]SFK18631.1 TRAP transporter T-component [Nitrosomonas aestuarii]
MLRWQVNFLKYSVFAFISISHSVFARAATEIFPDEYKQKIDIAVMRNAVDRPALLATISWVAQLAQSTRDATIMAELARLEYANAEVETEKRKRIELYKICIDTANKSLAVNPDEVGALYWKAIAMGKLSEETGILNAFRMTRAMERLFLRVITLNENYDHAGGHKALGRMYYKLPSFPISFGSNEKALFHLKKAYELYPNDVIVRAFYAELLFDMGQKHEARKHAEFILATSVEKENNFRYHRFIEIARNIVKKDKFLMAR